MFCLPAKTTLPEYLLELWRERGLVESTESNLLICNRMPLFRPTTCPVRAVLWLNSKEGGRSLKCRVLSVAGTSIPTVPQLQLHYGKIFDLKFLVPLSFFLFY